MPQYFFRSQLLELPEVSRQDDQSCRPRCLRPSEFWALLGRTVVDDADGRELTPEVVRVVVPLEVVSPVESAAEAQVAPQISDRVPEPAVVVPAAGDADAAPEEWLAEYSDSERSRAAGLVPEPARVVVAQGERCLAVAAAQANCPGSTKGRPGNRSSIEFVRT